MSLDNCLIMIKKQITTVAEVLTGFLSHAVKIPEYNTRLEFLNSDKTLLLVFYLVLSKHATNEGIL